MSYAAPDSLRAALDILHAGDATIIAGGTDWYPAQGEHVFRGALLDLTRIAALRGISQGDDGWRIGAATTWRDIIRADLPPAFDGLKAAAREVGSVQIQSAGTIAGNLCNASPAADGVPPLLTLEAQIELTSHAGTRVLPLAEFITGVRSTALTPGELVTAILIPTLQDAAQGSFCKLGARRYLVISIAMTAALVTQRAGRIDTARIAVGACSAVAQRLPELEAALVGAAPNEAATLIQPDHFKGLAPIDDVRGTAGYRHDAMRALTLRAVQEACHG